MDTLEQVTQLVAKPIYETGTTVQVSQQARNDAACRVAPFVGYTGIVRYMIANERGMPCEWCAVFWPHRAATSVWHVDAIEEVSRA